MVGTDTLTNAMLVKDERFNEWYVWTIGHIITAFGSYTDSSNVRHMVTGDSLGNTYVWGEQYASDASVPINYRIRTKYNNVDSPSMSKVPQPQMSISADQSDEATISVARNFNNQYKILGTASGFFHKFSTAGGAYPDYKTLSVEVAGSTTTKRPEFYGYTLSYDEEERFSDPATTRQVRGK